MSLIVDAHEDIAYNMLTYGRNYLNPVHVTRRAEAGTDLVQRANGDSLLGLPEYRAGRVALVFSTLFAAPKRCAAEWEGQIYADKEQAHKLYRGQLDLYHRLAGEHPEAFRLVKTRAELSSHLAAWQNGGAETQPIGLVFLMEGAEGVRRPAELAEWWALGLRIIGPAWVGTRFCGGMGEPGPLTPEGFELLDAMGDMGFALDISHMDEKAALQALERFPGKIIASHANANALLNRPDNRHLPDAVIRGLIDRGGVMGVMPLNTFLRTGWKHGEAKNLVTLDDLAAHIDYVCQMAGNADHVGVGTDFDGGFGMQSTPAEIDSIADLPKIGTVLTRKGYTPAQVDAVLGGNWTRMLEQILP